MRNFDFYVTPRLVDTILPALPYHTGLTVQMARLEKNVKLYRRFLITSAERGLFERLVDGLANLIERVREETGYRVTFPRTWAELGRARPTCEQPEKLVYVIGSIGLLTDCIVLLICVNLIYDVEAKQVKEPYLDIWEEMGKSNLFESAVFFNRILRERNQIGDQAGPLKPLPRELCLKMLHVVSMVAPPSTLASFVSDPGTVLRPESFVQGMLTDYTRMIAYYLWRTNPADINAFVAESYRLTLPQMAAKVRPAYEIRIDSTYRIDMMSVMGPTMQTMAESLDKTLRLLRQTPSGTHQQLVLYMGWKNLITFLMWAPNITDEWPAEVLEAAAAVAAFIKQRPRAADQPVSYDNLCLSALALVIPFDNTAPAGEYRPTELGAIWAEQVRLLASPHPKARSTALKYFMDMAGVVWVGCQSLANSWRYKVVVKWLVDLYPRLSEELFSINVPGMPDRVLVNSRQVLSRFYIIFTQFNPEKLLRDQKHVLENSPIALNSLLASLLFSHTSGAPVVWAAVALWEDEVTRLLELYASRTGRGTELCEHGLVLVYGLTVFIRSSRFVRRVKRENTLRLMSALVKLMGSQIQILLDKIMEFMICTMQFLSQTQSPDESRAFFRRVYDLISGLMAMQTPKLLQATVHEDIAEEVEHLGKFMQLRFEAGSRLFDLNVRIQRVDPGQATQLRAAVLRCLCSADHRTVMRALDCLRILHKGMSLGIVESGDDEQTVNTASDYALITEIAHSDAYQLQSTAVAHKCLINYFKTVVSPSPTLQLLYDTTMVAWDDMLRSLETMTRLDADAQRRMMVLHKFMFTMHTMWLRSADEALQQRSLDRIFSMMKLVLSPNHYVRDLTFSCLSLRLGLPVEYLNKFLQLIGRVVSEELVGDGKNVQLDPRTLVSSLTRLVASAQAMIEHIYSDEANTRIVMDDSIPQVAERVLQISLGVMLDHPDIVAPSLERLLGTMASIGAHDDLFMTKKVVLVNTLLAGMLDSVDKLSGKFPEQVEECTLVIGKALEALTDGYSFDIAPEGPSCEQYEQFGHLVKSVDRFRIRLGTNNPDGRSVQALYQRSLTNLFSSNIELAYLMLFDDAFLSDRDLRVGLYNAFATSVEEEQDAFVQMASRYSKLGDYLGKNREVLFAMCDTCSPTDAESLAELLVLFFENRNESFDIVGSIAELEVSRQKDCGDTFRQNSVLTKVVITFLTMKLSEWLTARLSPLVKRILKSRYVFTVQTAAPDEILVDCREFVADLVAHQDEVPLIARKFLRLVYDTVEKRFAGAGITALNNIFLLRCVCPAIVSPDRYAMMERPPVGGVLSTLLNNANAIQRYCSHRSPDSELRDRMQQFFMHLVDVDPTHTEETTLSILHNKNFDQVSFGLHSYMYRHGHEIRSACLRSPDFDMEEFTAMHRALGRPSSISLLNSTTRRRSKAWSARSGSTPRQMSTELEPAATVEPVLKYYGGVPCFIMSADMTVAHKNLVLSRLQQFQARVASESAGALCVLQDMTLPSITLEHWLALSDVILDAAPQELLSRFSEHVVLNLPYNIAHMSRSRRILQHPLRAYSFKTYEDMDINLMEELEIRDITLRYARDFSAAAKFERITVQHHGEVLLFDVHVGREAVHLRYRGPDFSSLDVVPFKRVHLDNLNFRVRLLANQGSFATTYVIEQQPHVYRKISTMKHRALSQRRTDMPPVVQSHNSDHTGALMCLALVDLCNVGAPTWTPAYKLLCALSLSLDFRTGPHMIAGLPKSVHKLQIRAVAEVSKHLVSRHPDTSGVVRMFTGMLGSEHVDLEAASHVAAPWLSHLAKISLGQDKEVDLLLVTLFTRMCESRESCETLCFSLLPNLEHSERATSFLADALIAFVVHRRMRGENPPDWILACFASMVTPAVSKVIFKHILALTKVDAGYGITKWSDHPNWLEIEVELTFLSYVRVDVEMLTDTLPLYLLCVLVFSGIGPYSFRLAQHRNFLNVVDALMSLPGLDDFAGRRLKTLWDELHSARCRTLFAIQDETIDSSYVKITDFTFHQAEQVGRLIYELYSTGAIIFRPVHELRHESQELMTRLVGVVFPSLQRRCIYGLCVVHRFEVPDETYESLVMLLAKVLRDCEVPEVLMVYVRAIFMALSKLILGVSRSSQYKQTLNIFVLAFLWHGLLPAYPEALPMFTNYMLINDYSGEFASQIERLDQLAQSFKPKFLGWWGANLDAPLPTAQNLGNIVNDVFVFGLQHADSQNVAMVAVETISYQITVHSFSRSEWNGTFWLPFAATMFLMCQDVTRLCTIPVLTSSITDTTILDNASILKEMTRSLASYFDNTEPGTMVTLAQCCSLTGHTTSMNFMHAGPRLLSLLSYVQNMEVISLVRPLLRPTILRLLELDDPEMNAHVLEWTAQLFRPLGAEDYSKAMLKILNDSGFGYLVDADLNLLPKRPRLAITPDIRQSLIGLCDSFFSTGGANMPV